MAKAIAILTLIGMAFGVLFWVDGRFAKCAEVKAIERRLDYKIESDVLNQKQDRLWKLQDRYGMNPAAVADPAIRQAIKDLQSDVDAQRDRVNRLEVK